MPLVLLLVAVALGSVVVLTGRSRGGLAGASDGDSSQREDEPDVDTPDPYRVPAEYQDIVDATLGAPYWYGKGSPATSLDAVQAGIDCSGLVQVCWVELGILPRDAPDRSARTLADACDPIAEGEQEPGDLAIYPGHVALCVSSPDEEGHSQVLSASGGTSATFGDDPDARVKLFDAETYRRDFVTWGRLKTEYRA